MGYPKSVKGYRLWCLEPSKRRCIVSKDVVFNKLEMTNISKEVQKDIGKEHSKLNGGNKSVQLEVWSMSQLRKEMKLRLVM